MRTTFLGSVAIVALGIAAPGTQVLAQASPSNFTAALRYDNERRVTGTIAPDPDGAGPLVFAASRNGYDAAGRLVRVEKGELATWQSEAVQPSNWTGFTVLQTIAITYDTAGRKLSEQVTGSDGIAVSLTQYSYDIASRLECTAVRMNPAIFGSPPASACTVGTSGSQGPDRITRNIYDPAGQLVQVRKAYGTSLEQAYASYSYTPNGKQEYVIDAAGNRAKMEYDGFDRQVKWVFPSATKPTSYNPSTQVSALATAGALNTNDYEQYGYDANSNRTSLKKRDGQVIAYVYDALNRMTSKDLPGTAADVSYSYDLQGHQLTALFASSGQGVTSAYDGVGRLTSSTTTMGGNWTLSYQYDADANRTQITHPDGKYFLIGYDGLDRMNNAQWNNLGGSGLIQFMSIGFNALGERSTINRASSFTDSVYNGMRLTSLTQRFAGNAGNLTEGFSYNPATQITSLSRDADEYAWTANYNVNRNYTANGLNQYSQINSSSTLNLSYDGNGNLTGDGSSTYVYDTENRLISASGAKSLALAYDPLGRLFQISGGAEGTVRFLYDGDHVAAEYDGNNNMLRRYMWGPGADEPILWDEGSALDCSGTKVLQPDHQSSTIAIANCWGQRTAIDSYDPNGIPAPSNTGRFQYTGQAWIPDLGMYYYKARIYSPTLGRFLQTDPIGYKDQINLYEYVGDDPVNHADSTGMYEQDVHYNLTEMLALAAGISPSVARQIAAGDQGVDDNPATSPLGMSPTGRDVQVRADYHFTSESRRAELYSNFQKSGKAGDLGIYLHAKQDSYSHAGYEARFGHLFAGHAPDKTFNDVSKADAMARSTFSTLQGARGRLGQTGVGLPYSDISAAIHNFNAADSAGAKNQVLGGLLKKFNE